MWGRNQERMRDQRSAKPGDSRPSFTHRSSHISHPLEWCRRYLPGRFPFWLSAQVQALDQRLVSVSPAPCEIVEQRTSLAHEEQQPAPRVMILRMQAHVLGQVPDPLGQEGDLDLGRSGISLFPPEFSDDFGGPFSREQHWPSSKDPI